MTDRSSRSHPAGSDAPAVPAETLDFLASHDTFYLLGHVEPDGDCIASALALGSYLERQMGKLVRYYNVGPFNRREIARYADRFEPRIRPEHRETDPDPAAIILDCTGPDRIGALEQDLDGLPLAVIDHHATGEPYGDARFVVSTSMATCYLVQLVIEELGGPLVEDDAELLLFGIATDTGYFRHAESNAADLFAGVSRLLEAGASPRSVHARMFGGHTLGSRQLLGTLLDRARSFGGGRGAITWETREDTARHGKQNRDSDTLYQLLFGIDGLRTAALVREEEGAKVSGSLRSIDSLDVSRIARAFGGGGHKRAAGFTAEMELQAAIDAVTTALEQAIDESEPSA
ncbi:MAG: DHH family phosphoesterase [Spirochaetota bacterium]